MPRVDWRELWRSGDLGRFCFISLGIVFHAGCENMITTILPAMVRDLGGVEFTGWTFAIYETGAIIAGAAAGRLVTYWTVRTNMIVAAIIFALGCVATVVAPSMPWLLGARLLTGLGGGALISLCFVATRRYFPASIWPQLMAILSVVWGVAAFGGPLYGGLIVTALSWRWAFIIFAFAALAFATATGASCATSPGRCPARTFPGRGACLSFHGRDGGGGGRRHHRATHVAALAVPWFCGHRAVFLARRPKPASRLFPSDTFNPRTTSARG